MADKVWRVRRVDRLFHCFRGSDTSVDIGVLEALLGLLIAVVSIGLMVYRGLIRRLPSAGSLRALQGSIDGLAASTSRLSGLLERGLITMKAQLQASQVKLDTIIQLQEQERGRTNGRSDGSEGV